MKNSFYLVWLIAISSLFMGCNKNDKEGVDDVTSERANISITLKSNVSKAKALVSGTSPTQAEENKVNDFTVYIFNDATNILEFSQKYEPQDDSEYTQLIQNLTTGMKKIVVLANVPAGYKAPVKYADLARNKIDLGSQTVFNKLAMSGEATKDLLPDIVNTVDIDLTRLVAKIRLGSVTISPDPGNTETLTLDSVYIMKAIDSVTMAIPTLTLGSLYYGGRKGTLSTEKSYLVEEITGDPSEDNTRYFYTFPSSSDKDEATLITLTGMYGTKRTYFPFRISNSSGTFVTRNTYYTVDVTIKRTGSGSNDPETPVDPATLEVTVTPVNWLTVDQSVTW